MKTAEDLLKEKGTEIISVNPDTSLLEAAKILVDKKIGGVAVKEGEKYVGIWTERDLVRNFAENALTCSEIPIKDVMVTNLITAKHDESIYTLMDKFLGKRLRHLFIEKNNEIIGLLSIGDVVKANLNEKTKELEELNAVFNWDYYNNWRWRK
jgi:CBS domain-containing protein